MRVATILGTASSHSYRWSVVKARICKSTTVSLEPN
ncbi:hypothetical protein A1F99_052740 [Pyrenophora tritici-repentis]|nr:hypothetical protein A1F99_052740 [Pyrenophora tritici-repentis]